MANPELPKCCSTIVIFLSIFAIFTHATTVKIPLGSVSDLLIQSTLDSLNDNSPTGHTYKSYNLTSAQKLLEPQYVTYRLTLNLEPNCDDESSCPREACAIVLRQHEHGVIDVEKNSIQCMYLYPQSDQATAVDTQRQTLQDDSQNVASIQEQQQETMETFEKRESNASLQLVHEVQTVTDGNDRPFIAVRAIDRNYCAGCPYELNPTLPGLGAYGEQIVQSMDDTGRSDFKHKVVSIVRVTRAVPPGSNVVLYELMLEIGETNCLRIGMSVRTDCSLLPNVPIKLCLVTFEQRPWQQDSRKIVRNNCTDLPDIYNDLTGNFAQPSITSDNVYIISTSSKNDNSPTTSTNNDDKIFQQTDNNEKLSTSKDNFFDGIEITSTSDPANEKDTKNPVTEIIHEKIVTDRKNNETKIQGFDNKYKEFDDFLEKIDFNTPIKHHDPKPVDRDTRPVNEEIIRPEIVVRTNSERSNDVSVGNDDERVEIREKRSIIVTTSDEREIVRKLAQKVVDELDEIDIDDKKRVLLDVLDSKKQQTVDDTIFYITMKVATSNCLEDTTDCSYDTGETGKICKAQIQTNSLRSLETARVLQSQCFDDVNRRNERSRRQTPGGLTQRSVDDPEIKDYAEKGLRKFSTTYGGEKEPFLVEIVEATSQVVSGMLHKIKVKFGESTCSKGVKENCQLNDGSQVDDYLITVRSQPWKDNGNPDISIESVSDKDTKRARRSSHLVGAPTTISPEDPEIREYVKKGLTKYSETFGGNNEPYLVEIIESTKQIVSGTLYKIKVRLGDSTCPRGTKENCQLNVGSKVDDYLITVWSQPWKDNGNPDISIKSVSNKDTKRARRSSQLVGAPATTSPEDPEIREYVKKGLTKYSETFGVDNEPYLVEIIESTKQIVSGTLYKIKVRLGDSTCSRGMKENCELKSHSRLGDYEITVWSQPWVDHGHPDIKIKLLSGKKRVSKRSLRGQNYSAKMLKLGEEIKAELAFERFMKEHERTYESEEEKNYRFGIFRENMRIMEDLRKNEKGTAEYGATIFADLTPEEFRVKHLGLRRDLRSQNEIPLPMADIPNIVLPEEFDWRHRNVVTEVKNQGSCGSCWAFSVTGNIESLNAIKYGKLLSLSEQELVDCDKFDEGCEGGLPENAYRAIEQLGGLEIESDYPYDGKDEKCHFDDKMIKVSISSGLNITTNETQMAQWLVKNGPITIGINANAMQFYMGGVSHPLKFLCNGDNLDHGVLIVGYGIHTYPIFHKKMPYWIIKNSWGPRWGEQGYYRVYRGDGTCGLNRMATSAVIV